MCVYCEWLHAGVGELKSCIQMSSTDRKYGLTGNCEIDTQLMLKHSYYPILLFHHYFMTSEASVDYGLGRSGKEEGII